MIWAALALICVAGLGWLLSALIHVAARDTDASLEGGPDAPADLVGGG